MQGLQCNCGNCVVKKKSKAMLGTQDTIGRSAQEPLGPYIAVLRVTLLHPAVLRRAVGDHT